MEIKIAVAGYYGFGNVGDELLLSTIVSQLRDRYRNVQITVFSANPPQTQVAYGVRSVYRWDPISLVQEIWRSDFLVVGGGGLLQNQTSNLSLFYYLGLVLTACVLRCPTVLYAVGVEQLKGTWARWLTRFALNSNRVKITVRDQASQDSLIELGIPSHRIALTADPAFLFRPEKPATARYGDYEFSALLIPRFPCPPQAASVFSAFHQILRAKNAGVKALLFQPSHESRFVAADGACGIPTADFIGDTATADIARKIGEFDIVVSARFHGLLLAALAGRPFIGVGDPNKVGRLCVSFGMPYLPWDASVEDVRQALSAVSGKKDVSFDAQIEQSRRFAQHTVHFVG